MWGLPALISVVQVLLMVFVFKYDTPTEYKQRADYDHLRELFSKMYIEDHIQMRIDEI